MARLHMHRPRLVVTPSAAAWVLALLFLVLPTTAAIAQQDGVDAGPEVEVYLTPYVWSAGQRGDVAVVGIPAEANAPFSEILSGLQVAGLGRIEVRSGDWSFGGSGIYLDLDTERRLAPLDLDVDYRQLVLEARASRRVATVPLGSRGSMDVALLAGLMYTRVSIDVDVVGFDIGVKQKRGWLDPLVGVELATRVSRTTRLDTRLETGGFGIGSDRLWRAGAELSVDVSERLEAFVGYALTSYDYDHRSGFRFDVSQRGPTFGLRGKL